MEGREHRSERRRERQRENRECGRWGKRYIIQTSSSMSQQACFWSSSEFWCACSCLDLCICEGAYEGRVHVCGEGGRKVA